MRRFVTIAAVLALALMAAGCGVYSASSGRVDESIKRVHVQYLENRTAEPNLGVELADLIIRKLQEDNTLRVVDEVDADAATCRTMADAPEIDPDLPPRSQRYDVEALRSRQHGDLTAMPLGQPQYSSGSIRRFRSSAGRMSSSWKNPSHCSSRFVSGSGWGR